MFEPLQEKYQVCLVDRAGYGMSSDTNEERTIDVIVEEYRAVLNAGGISGKYILVAHSISGMYAQYWASMYPEEMEGIVYVDATPPEAYVEEGEVSTTTKIFSKTKNIACFTG